MIGDPAGARIRASSDGVSCRLATSYHVCTDSQQVTRAAPASCAGGPRRWFIAPRLPDV